MSTAWEFLLQNSTIADNNIAWDHIQNQGGAGDIIINRIEGINVIASPIETAVIMEVIPTVVVEQEPVTVVVEVEDVSATTDNNIRVIID